MKYTYNDGSAEENAVQNRFTAYLKTSLGHNAARYEAKLMQKSLAEESYSDDETAWDRSPESDPFERLSAGEFDHTELRQGLVCLREVERSILFQHVLQDKPLKQIAEELDCPYSTVKSHYRRALEKLRKKLSESDV